MKILSAQQMQQWDAFTIQTEPIESIQLMERAAAKCVAWIEENFFRYQKFKIFCGKGNNGGDGLAIARMLIEKGYSAVVYILEFGAKGTNDFQINLQQLHPVLKEIHFIQSENFFPFISEVDIVIDALFGTGLNRPLQDLSAALVQHINRSQATIISIDVPSGMRIDKSSKNYPVITAHTTLSFQAPKLCFFMAENAENFGEVHLLDIELHEDFLETITVQAETVEKDFIAPSIKPRNAFAHKGNFGHVLMMAGSIGKTGAAIISSGAALRTGCGLVTTNLPSASIQALHARFPEAMIQLREEGLSDIGKFSAIAVGPGFGIDVPSQQLLKQVLQSFFKPIVIDADALTILSLQKDWLKLIPAGSILTPHPKEFDRLFGVCENDFERMEKAVELSKQYACIIVLKGHHTLIAANGKAYFNTSGNVGLAKGGSGDVLTGMIVSLLAQQYPSLHAALIGVYLHGLAADLALEQQSYESLLATDVINTIGKAFNFLRE